MNQGAMIEAIQRKCKDEESRLTDQDWEDCLVDALAEYSQRRPDVSLADVTGDGTVFLTVPGGWEPDFSEILRLDELDSEGRPTEIRRNRVTVDRPAGADPRVMRMDGCYFTDGTTYRLTYSVAHTLTAISSSIPGKDEPGVIAYGASLACTRLAAAYAQSENPQFGSVTMDFKSKTGEYRRLAKDYLEEFERVCGGSRQPGRGRGTMKTWTRESPLLLHP